MQEKHLHIKNMVCPRCIMAVRDTLEKQGAQVLEVKLGEARFLAPGDFSLEQLQEELNSLGFQLLQNPEQQLTEQIRIKVLEYVGMLEEAKTPPTLSSFLTDALHRNYTALSKHFARQQGQTIENFYIHCRIERVKELLHDSQLNLSQIANQLAYSSVHYLSGQFKKVTGLSVSEYRSLPEGQRRTLDKL